MMLVDTVFHPYHRTQIVDDIVPWLIDPPPKLLRQIEFHGLMRHRPGNLQPVTHVRFRVETVVAAPLVAESRLHHGAIGDFPIPELRRNGQEAFHPMTVVEQLVVAVMIVQEIVRHPDFNALLPKRVIGPDADFGAVIMGEIVVEPQLSLQIDMPAFEDFVRILHPRDTARLKLLGVSSTARQ